jgi:hypothetical protein
VDGTSSAPVTPEPGRSVGPVQSVDPIVARARVAAPVAVRGEDVKAAVRSDDRIAQPAETPLSRLSAKRWAT